MSPDTPLKGLPLAAVDIEATGFSGPDAHVVEIAVVHATFGSDEVRVAYSSRVRPPVPIPASATQVHGITDADVTDAPEWGAVMGHVSEAVEGRLPIGFCAPADHEYIATECARLGLPSVVPHPWLCLLVVRRATKTRGRPGKLSELAAEHGIVLDAHGATGDALTTALLARPLLRAAVSAGAFRGPEGAQPRRYGDYQDEGPPPFPKTVGEPLAWQRGAALYQEREWASYRREQGDAQAPRSPWHALYGEAPPTWEAPKRTRLCATCSAPVVMSVGKGGALETIDARTWAVHECPR